MKTRFDLSDCWKNETNDNFFFLSFLQSGGVAAVSIMSATHFLTLFLFSQMTMPHRVQEDKILFKKSKSGLVTYVLYINIFQTDYIYASWHFYDLIRCALGHELLPLDSNVRAKPTIMLKIKKFSKSFLLHIGNIK